MTTRRLSLLVGLLAAAAALCFPNGTVYVYDGTTIQAGQQLEVLACGVPTTFCEQEAAATLLEANPNITSFLGGLTLAEYATNYEEAAAAGPGGQERPLVYSTVVGGNWTTAQTHALQSAGRLGIEAPAREDIAVDAASPWHTMMRTMPSVYGTPLVLRLTTTVTAVGGGDQAVDDPHELVLRVCRDTRCREYTDYDLGTHVNRGVSGLPHPTLTLFDDVVSGLDMVLHHYTGAPMIFFDVRYCVPGAPSARVPTAVDLFRLLCESPLSCAAPSVTQIASTFTLGTSAMDGAGTACDVFGRAVWGYHTLRVTNTPTRPELPAVVLEGVNSVATLNPTTTGPRQIFVYGCDQADCSTATAKSGINGVSGTTAFDESAGGFGDVQSALAVATDHGVGLTYVAVWGDVDGTGGTFETEMLVCDLVAGGLTVGTCSGPFALAAVATLTLNLATSYVATGTGGRLASMLVGASGRLHYVVCPWGDNEPPEELRYATQADADVATAAVYTDVAAVSSDDDFAPNGRCSGHTVVLELHDGTVWMAFQGQYNYVVVATCLQPTECRSTPLGGTPAYGRRHEHPTLGTARQPMALDAYVGPRGLPLLVVYWGLPSVGAYTEEMSVYECQNTHCEPYRGATSGAAGP